VLALHDAVKFRGFYVAAAAADTSHASAAAVTTEFPTVFI